jgi:hypothetical protein
MMLKIPLRKTRTAEVERRVLYNVENVMERVMCLSSLKTCGKAVFQQENSHSDIHPRDMPEKFGHQWLALKPGDPLGKFTVEGSERGGNLI